MRFFSSYIGMYVVQSVCHSLLTLLIVELSLRIWQVREAAERFRYRVLVLVFPFVMFPAFQLVNPQRSSFYFVEDSAVFSSMRWLKLDLFGRFPLAYLFLLLTLAVSVVVIIQEIVPIVRDLSAKANNSGTEGRRAGPELEDMVAEMSSDLKIERPEVTIIQNEHPLIYTSGTTTHAIVISEPLLDILDLRQLRSALAHELAHIMRRSNFMTLIVFLVRLCMFYNPVSLLEFRRLVQDDEHICDDITVSITGDPQALASALDIFCLDVGQTHIAGISDLRETIESSSHNLLLKERIERLEQVNPVERVSGRWGRYALTVAMIAAVNYFVV